MLLFAATILVSGCDKGEGEKGDNKPAFELIFGGKVLENNAKIVADKYEAGDNSCNIEFRNNTKKASTIEIKKELISTAPANLAEINQFCWGDLCVTAIKYSMTAEVAPYASMVFKGQVWTATLPADSKTDIKIRYTFTDKTNNLVQSVEVSYIYPKPL